MSDVVSIPFAAYTWFAATVSAEKQLEGDLVGMQHSPVDGHKNHAIRGLRTFETQSVAIRIKPSNRRI